MLARTLVTPAFSSIARSASRYISMKAAGERGGITADERFLFDLNGFLVLRGILSPEEVAAANAAVDAKQSLLQSRDTAALRNTKAGTWPHFEPSRQWPPADLCACVTGSPLDASGPRLDMGGMLFWEQPHCEVFRNMLCHPKLVPYITELCGMGYRLDHQPLLLAQAPEG
jgi:hypothetical protein